VGASAAFAPTLIARSECADTGILGNTPLLEQKLKSVPSAATAKTFLPSSRRFRFSLKVFQAIIAG
jgi:hypothetical protein